MKTKKTELDVDIIGDPVGLTTTEEKALSDFFRQRKLAEKEKADLKRRRTQSKAKILPFTPE